jgi:signal transduction histidine kinase/CheY-like chemotaxis protein
MPRTRIALLALLRGAALGVAFAAMFLVDGLALHGLHADIARGLVLLFSVGLLLPAAALLRPVAPLLVLAADLIAIGTVGTFLRLPDSPHLSPMASVPFLAGYVVAALVATTGRRLGAAGLGALAGVMLVVLGESALPTQAPAPSSAAPAAVAASPEPGRAAPEAVDPSGPAGAQDRYLLLRLLLVAVAAFECAVVTGWIDSDLRRRRTAQSVERELRSREVIAGELATFVAAANGAAWLPDLAEALLLHLRRHFPTRARGVVLEDANSRVALWEEAGQLDPDLIEARRLRLQDALREAGSSTLVLQVEARSTSGKTVSKGERLATRVAIPVHAGGRVAGVIVLADTRRNVLPEDRIGALAEMARQVGDSILRLDRQRNEQTRRTSLLLGQMREGVLLVGPDGRVLLSNPAGREVLLRLGQDAETPISLGEMGPAELAAIPAGSVRRSTVVAQGRDEHSDQRYALAAVGVIDAGARLGTLVTVTDVTEEERARDRLMQAEKLSVVGQTLASVAHELNNPLAAIVGYSDLLADAPVPEEVEKILTRIREQATRTSRIVKNLLSVARRRGPERSLLSLNDVVQSVIDLFAYDARLSSIAIASDLAPDLPHVLADRSALQQVLVNLVQNAVHAQRGRGHGAVTVRTRTEGSFAALSVIDDGPGVPIENRARIFEPFFTTKGPNEGTGLGLAISRGIARDHGGDLLLQDREDGLPGAMFTMRVPLVEGDPLAAASGEALLPEGVDARILVVDDESPVRESLTAQLRRLGAQVDAAATPLEAARLLDRPEGYDAVLMDLRLPGQSGLDLHRALRARNPALAKRVVFMTGDLVNADLLAAVRETGNPLLEKPFTAVELRGVLQQVVEAGAAENA